jgi:hypothetical protein
VAAVFEYAEDEVPERRCHAVFTALQLHALGDPWAAAASTGPTAGARSDSCAVTDKEATSIVDTTASR